MANTKIEVNTVSLKGDVTSIEGEIRSLRKAAENLRSTSSQLDSMWEGEAKVKFQAAVRDDLNKLESLISAVEKFTRQTDSSRTEYERCENAVAQIIASIKV